MTLVTFLESMVSRRKDMPRYHSLVLVHICRKLQSHIKQVVNTKREKKAENSRLQHHISGHR